MGPLQGTALLQARLDALPLPAAVRMRIQSALLEVPNASCLAAPPPPRIPPVAGAQGCASTSGMTDLGQSDNGAAARLAVPLDPWLMLGIGLEAGKQGGPSKHIPSWLQGAIRRDQRLA